MKASQLTPTELTRAYELANSEWKSCLDQWISDALKNGNMSWPDRDKILIQESIFKTSWMDGYATGLVIGQNEEQSRAKLIKESEQND